MTDIRYRSVMGVSDHLRTVGGLVIHHGGVLRYLTQLSRALSAFSAFYLLGVVAFGEIRVI